MTGKGGTTLISCSLVLVVFGLVVADKEKTSPEFMLTVGLRAIAGAASMIIGFSSVSFAIVKIASEGQSQTRAIVLRTGNQKQYQPKIWLITCLSHVTDEISSIAGAVYTTQW